MSGAFGVIVTRELVEGLPIYHGREVNQVDLAREAARSIQAEGKNIDALSHALELKYEYGNGISAHCLIYNATGARLQLVDSRNWYGRIFKMEPPRSFENGQWISFLHVKDPSVSNGAIGARVYRATDVDGNTRDFLVAWNCPWGNAQNSVITEVRPMGYFSSRWDAIYNALRRASKVSGYTSDKNFESSITIGGLPSSEYIALLQHKFQPLPEEL